MLVTTHNMEEAEQCDRLIIMVEGKVVARGTSAGVVGDRKVSEVRCGDWNRAFALLDVHGFPVQLHGTVLRVGRPPADVAGLLSREGIDATIDLVPANLEEAFVAIVTPPAAV